MSVSAQPVASDGKPGQRPSGWALAVLTCFSLLNFLGFASTFSALGVTLPFMVEDQAWSWTLAGLGFTLLGVASASSSFLPAYLIRKFGVRAPLILGAFVLAGGLMTLCAVSTVSQFLIATVLCGVGFQLIAMIPGTHVLSVMFKQRSLVFGIYMTSASLGGVAGPWIVLSVMSAFDGDWRMVWLVLALAVFVTSLVSAAIVGQGSANHQRREEQSPAPPENNWGFSVQAALRKPQFWVICAAYLSQVLVLSSVASMSIAHLTETGTVATVAAAMLSLEAAVQVIARLGGGVIGEFVNRKLLLMIGLACLVGGVWTLSVAQGYPALLAYALLAGIGVGLTALASTLLLLDWFGRKHNLELFSIMCTLVAVSSVNSVIGGAIRDVTGSFTLAYQLFGGVPALVLVAMLFARPPAKTEAQTEVSS